MKNVAALLPGPDSEAVVARPLEVFISYKWEVGAHVSWVRRLAADLRSNGIEALLDQWEVYRSGTRSPHYVRDHRDVYFRDDKNYKKALRSLTEDLLGRAGRALSPVVASRAMMMKGNSLERSL